jgi:class 3 adenylate cyclase/tetratricopeptide (TPR) repeat protein
MACPGCGFACSPDFAFCPKCGTRVRGEAARPAPEVSRPASVGSPGPADSEADRRPVTVLFADLAGFTTLGERLDPEEVRALQGELFEEMTAVIKRFDGFVEKFVGDAVMAVFGAPVAHEDDPERALHAALAMHERMAGLSGRWERRLGASLRLHVGVHTGPVVAGSLGATPEAAYAVTGDTVNTAARLQGAATPGQTFVSATTQELARHAFAFENLGDIALRGKADRVTVYRLVGVAETPGASRGLEAHGLVAPLIGRDEPLEEMLAAFDRVAGGRAELVSVVGEVGTGKSRLLQEFLARLESTGRLDRVTLRRATCSSLGEPAYGVVGAFFRQGFGIDADDTLEAAEEKVRAALRALAAGPDESAWIVSVVRYLLGIASAPSSRLDVDPEQVKRQIFVALRFLFERRLERGPCVLLVEDLHRADAASIELLEFMAERLTDRALMLLFTYRPPFDARPLATRRAAHTTVRLGPLSTAESESVLTAFFGESEGGLPDGLRDLVVRRSGGNPLYLEEIVRGLIASGVLVHEDGRWRCTADTATLEVPATLQGLLLSRVDRLSPTMRRVAQEASVLGPAFDGSLLGMVASDPEECQVALRELVEAELLEDVTSSDGRGSSGSAPDRRYRFTHGLVHEVIYQNLLVRRRTALHERAGRALEAQSQRGDRARRLEDLEALGHHFGLSSDKPAGARYLTAAGDWARGIYANADAVRNYERALRTLEECGPNATDRFAVAERLGDVLGLMGRREAALSHFAAVLSAATADGDRPAQARLHRKMAALHWNAGQRDLARRALEDGLALLEGGGEHIELAHLYQEMGRLLFRSGDSHGASVWAERALAQAERLAPPAERPGSDEMARDAAAAMAHAYNTLGVALARVERIEEAVRHIEQSVKVAETHGLLQVACRGYANLSVLYSSVDPGQAVATCQRGLELAKRIGDPAFQSRLYANLAVAYCALTNRCDGDGVAAAQAAIELDRQLGQLDHLAVPLIVLGQIYQCHAEPQLALRYYREALAVAEEVGEPQLLFPCYDGLATLHLDLDDLAGAESYMRKARQVCEEAGVEPDSLTVLPFLA